jgi:hypothetical protein
MDNFFNLVTFACTIVFGSLLCVMAFVNFNTKNKAAKMLELIESNIKEDAKTCSARDMVENQLSQTQHSRRAFFVHQDIQRELHDAKNALRIAILDNKDPSNYKAEIHNFVLAAQKLHYIENRYIYTVPLKDVELDESHHNVYRFKSKA